MTLPKLLFLLSIISILFVACGDDDDCVESGMNFTWSTNRTIEIDPEVANVPIGDSLISLIEYQVIEGQDFLFEFSQFSNFCDPEIADGVGTLDFVMVVPADSTDAFTYTDQEILETSAFVRVFAAPDGLPDQSVEEGEISGVRIDDNSWRISIDVVSSLQEYGEILGDVPES